MGEPQHATIALDEAGVDGLVDRRPRFAVVTGRADQPLARIGGGCHESAYLPHIPRQLAHVPAHEVAEAVRNGDGLVGEGHLRAPGEGTRIFEGVEGVPAARLMQPREYGPGQHRPQPAPDDLADRRHADRPQPEAAETGRRQGQVQAEREAAAVVAERQQDGDRLPPQPPEAELEHASRRAVQPAGVVHRDYDRRLGRKDPQSVEHSPRQPSRLGPGPDGGVTQQREFHRSPPRARKGGKDLVGDVAEQVIEGREGERPFGRGGPARQHQGRTAGGLEQVLPHHGLADTGIAGDRDCGWFPGRGRQKRPDLRDLGLSPDWP